jgi:RNA polymerase primary sigma factor
MSSTMARPMDPSKVDRALSGREGFIALSRDEERDLADRARAGDDEAAWTLCMANQNFVRSLAQRYLRHDIDLDDLVGEGMVGLLEAARRFDADHGVKFITYGAWWVKRAMLQYLRTFEHPVHVPKYKHHAMQQVKREQQRLAQELGRMPALTDLAASTREDERSLGEMAGLMASHDSLDDEACGLSEILHDDSDVEETFLRRDALLRLDEVLPVLSDRERQVLSERFGFDGEEGATLAELGRRIGLTKERVRQIERQACDRLRDAMLERGVVRTGRRIAAA